MWQIITKQYDVSLVWIFSYRYFSVIKLNCENYGVPKKGDILFHESYPQSIQKLESIVCPNLNSMYRCFLFLFYFSLKTLWRKMGLSSLNKDSLIRLLRKLRYYT